jgi:hypothetical protein
MVDLREGPLLRERRGSMPQPQDSLDGYLDGVALSLGLVIVASWKQSVRANLEVTLRMGRLVDEFPLPDEIEPAEIYEA